MHRVVGDGDAAGGIGGRKLPWRIAGDDIEQTPVGVFKLSRRKLVEEVRCIWVADLAAERDRPELLDVAMAFEHIESLVMLLWSLHVFETESLGFSV